MANYLVETLLQQAEKYRNRAFYRFKEPGSGHWELTSWMEFHDSVLRAGRALYALGVKELDKAILCSPNRPELLIAEYACFFNRMAGVPVYAHSTVAQFSFIANDSGAQIAFIGSSDQYALAHEYASKHPGALKSIILLTDDTSYVAPDDMTTMTWSRFMQLGDNMELQTPLMLRADSGTPSDLASLIYTSGTTGEPKGVILNHSQFESQLKEHLVRLTDISENELSLCFLPMSHVFEKAWMFFCVVKGLRVAFNYDPREIESALHETNPNLMCCVPRFWEKIYTAIMQRIDSMTWIQRMMTYRALKVCGRVNLHYRRLGKNIPFLLKHEFRFWDRRLISKVKKAIGIPYPNIFPTAGAALSPKICEFMRSIGADIIMGYGLTESTATVTCFPKTGYEIGTVGTPLSQVQIKIDNTGEILLKGPTITPGYYHNEEANKAAFTNDGWFRTGDAGYFDTNGALVLSARKKELFKTSNGKYISLQYIESLMASNPYIDAAAVIGEQRKYVTALVVPDFHALDKWAKAHGLSFESREAMCADPRINQLILKGIHSLQSDMAEFETVKYITLLPHSFSLEKGEMTNTLKLKRNVIAKNYADAISAMYPDKYLD